MRRPLELYRRADQDVEIITFELYQRACFIVESQRRVVMPTSPNAECARHVSDEICRRRSLPLRRGILREGKGPLGANENIIKGKDLRFLELPTEELE